MYQVGEVARLAHVSVRTLHHYDESGLLSPSARTDAGYRLYTDRDLQRLQQILFYKELGFKLDHIRHLMSSPDFDRRRALVEQRALIHSQSERLQAVLAQIDRTIAQLDGELTMSNAEMFSVFGDFKPSEYEEEARQQWGDSNAYQESARRTKQYTKVEWQQIKEEGEQLLGMLAALLDEGVAPDDPRALDAVENYRLYICHWFYDCSRTMHRELGKMYLDDARFKATFEKVRSGLAQFVCDAIAANTKRDQND